MPGKYVVALSAGLIGSALAISAGGEHFMKAAETSVANFATEQAPAIVALQNTAVGGVALEVTARPVGNVGSSPPYLIGVFDEGTPPNLLGSFSFFPPRAGVEQTFVIPLSNPSNVLFSGKDPKVSIKLIPANPAADIQGAIVEILGARVIK